jgi:hypothetical protein
LALSAFPQITLAKGTGKQKPEIDSRLPVRVIGQRGREPGHREQDKAKIENVDGAHGGTSASIEAAGAL